LDCLLAGIDLVNHEIMDFLFGYPDVYVFQM
jgi:hypothetical protein